jgi:nucleoside-diphosphate-sugar epimerase
MSGAQRQVLVTGAAGFVGSALVRRLRLAGHRVRGIDLPDLAGRAAHDPCLGHDLTQPLSARQLAGVSLVFHAAALAGVQASWERPEEYWITNARGSRLLREACESCAAPPRVIHVSSISVYGPGLHLDEALAPCPVSPYGHSKLAGERAWDGYPRVRIVRLSNVYGPGQRPDMAYATFIRAALSGAGIVLRDDGRQLRTPTYIEDCVAGLMRSATHGADGGVYNVAGPEDVRLLDVPRQLARLLGAPIPMTAAPPGRGDPRVATVSIARARRELGYAPRTRLRDGLARQLATAHPDISRLVRVADA